MARKFVVGLFETRGIAEDAVNRLKTEGVPPRDVRNTYAEYIRNGETAVFVCTESEEEIEQAIGTIRQYSPMRIRVVTPGEGAATGRDVL